MRLMAGKATGDFLVRGKVEDILNYMRELYKKFKVGKISIGGSFRFIGCEVDVGDEMVELSMWDYLE